MRIAFVVHDYHRQGGHSRYVSELAERYCRDHEVHIFANRFPEGAPLFPESAAPEGKLFFRPVLAHRATALGTVLSFFLPATWALWRAGRFDVIHAQGFVCAQRALLTAHICCAAWHECRLQSGFHLGWKERLFDSIASRLERWVYRRHPEVPLIAISRRVQADLDHYYHRRNQVFVIPHGVDTSEFDVGQKGRWRRELRQSLGLGDDELVALWVGDLRKGAPAAIEALGAASPWKLIAVSRNDPKPFAELAEKTATGRVLFAPPTKEIARYYAAADCFLFPTVYDAFGMVVLEAMALDLPVIVSKDAGAAELIHDGVDGLLIDNPFATEQMAEHLRQLAADPAWRHSLGLAGGETARAASWDRVARMTFELYGRIAP